MAWPPRWRTRTAGRARCGIPAARARRQRSMSSKKRNWRGSNGPSRRRTSVRAARQAAIAQPTVRGRSARYGSARSRSGVGRAGGGRARAAASRRCRGAGARSAGRTRPGRAAAATHSRPSAARAASRGQRVVEQLAVRVEQHGDVMARTLDARVVGGAEAGVGAELDDLRARRPRERRAVVGRGGVDDDQLRRPGRRASDRSRAGSGPAESCSTTTSENVTPPPPRSTARVRRAVSRPARAARWPRGPRPAAARAAPGRPRRASSAAASAAASPGRHVERAVAEHLAEHGQVADDRGRARGEPLDGREAEALQPRRQHDRERAGVERAEVVDAPEPPDARAPRAASRPSPAITSSASSPRARARRKPRRARPAPCAARGRRRTGSSGLRGRRRTATAAQPRGERDRGTRAAAQPPLADSSSRTASVSHSTRAARRASRARPRGRCHSALVAREVLRARLPRAVVDGQDERRAAERQRRRRRRPDDVAAPPSSAVERGRPDHGRGANSARAGSGWRTGDRRLAAPSRRPARQQHAVLVVRERRGEGLQQGGRIVRHPACPAADQAAPVDPDPHARCPVTASPSTPAPPPAPSSAAWSAGRASSRARLPALRPGAYAVLAPAAAARPPRRPRLGAARAAAASRSRARAAVPGQPRAARLPAQRRRDPRRRGAAPPRVVLPAYAAWQRRVLPALARRALHVVTVSEFSRGELVGLLGGRGRARQRDPGGVDAPSRPEADPARPRRARPRAALRALRRLPDRPQEPAALVPARALARTASRSSSPAGAARSSPASTGSRRCATSATCPTRCCPGSTRAPRRSCCPPTTRASACRARGDGVRHAGGRGRQHRAARDRGGAARLAAPGGVRGGGLRVARRPGRAQRLSAAGSRAPRRSPGSGPRASSTPCSALNSPRRLPEHASERAVTQLVAAPRRSPDQANAFCEPSRESHVYQMTRWILQALARAREQRQRQLEPRRLPALGRSRSRARPWSCPATAGHDSSVSHTGLRPSRKRAHLAARELDQADDVARPAGVRVQGDGVERAAPAGPVDLAQRDPALVRQPGEDRARARVGGAQRAARGAQQLHVGLARTAAASSSASGSARSRSASRGSAPAGARAARPTATRSARSGRPARPGSSCTPPSPAAPRRRRRRAAQPPSPAYGAPPAARAGRCAAAATTTASVAAKEIGPPAAGCAARQSNAARTDSTPDAAIRSHSDSNGLPGSVSGPSACTPSQPRGTLRADAGAARSSAARAPRQRPRGASPAQALDHVAGHAQAQGQNPGEVHQHRLGELRLGLRQLVEAVEVDARDLHVGERVERRRARAPSKNASSPTTDGASIDLNADSSRGIRTPSVPSISR